MRARTAVIFVTLAVVSCSDSKPPRCVDEACAFGQHCVDGECVAIAPPAVTGDLGRYTSLALRDDGRSVIATYDSTHGNLVLLLELEDGSLEPRFIDGWRIDDHALVETDSGRWPSVAVASDGVIHLAWYDVDGGQLRYTTVNGREVSKTTIVDGHPQDRGLYASLAVTRDGVVHIAYRDATERVLRHAQRTPEGPWLHTTIDNCPGLPDCRPDEEDYGEYASLSIVAAQPVIAFYDRLRGDLRLAARTEAGAWEVSTLDGSDPDTGADTGDMGRFATTAVYSQNRLALAYFDATRSALRYLLLQPPKLVPMVVDDGVHWDADSGTMRNHIVGQHACLVFDDEDRAVLLYLDATRLTLRRATVAGGYVFGPSDLQSQDPGGHIACQRDPSGRIRVAYGAWLADQAPNTRLSTFELSGGPR